MTALTQHRAQVADMASVLAVSAALNADDGARIFATLECAGFGPAEIIENFGEALALVERCEARQYSDQMVCEPCRLTWDINDPDRPACRRELPVKAAAVVQTAKRAGRTTGSARPRARKGATS